MPASFGTYRALLYCAIWRWHSLVGLFVAPIMMAMAVTGGIYLFKNEIEEFIYYRQMHVPSSHHGVLPLNDQESSLLRHYPLAKVQHVMLPRRTDLATEWSLRLMDGTEKNVFVNPYNAEILGAIDPKNRLMNIIIRIHRNLLGGKIGQFVIELAACWGCVLIVTGIYLWWPRGQGIQGAFFPRLRIKDRIFWRDLHAVPAMWISIGLLFLILSGLPWAIFSGEIFATLGPFTSFSAPSPYFHGAIVPHVEHRVDDTSLSWTIQHSPVPESSCREKQISYQEVMNSVIDRQMPLPGLKIIVPSNLTEIFKVHYLPDKIKESRTIYLDPYNGDVLQDIAWKDYSPIAKAIEFGVSVHMGREFGWLNKILGLFVCIFTFTTALAGIIIWWKRCPKERFGVPQLPSSSQHGKGVVVITIVFSFVFPLVGLSLISFFLFYRAQVKNP